MENKRESDFLELGKKRRAKNKSLCIQMYGYLLRYHLSVALAIMLCLLMMQLEKLGFIVFKINLMYLIISRALVEIEIGKKLKCLRSNNGGEYCSKEFDRYCSDHGIRREKAFPRTPQENGVSERMNRTIMERARCMRLHVGFPLKFLADAIDTAVYLIDRGPSSSLDGGIPEEAWTGKKVNYSFLKPFGCEALIKKT